jgi:hypothetical protein
MKFRLLFFAFLIFCYQGVSSQSVSKTIQKRSILLEEFTGIYCGNCPDGHLMAKYLQYANDNVYVVAIHAGHYAEPDPGHPDYRISGGEIIDTEFNDYGYPGGTINRHVFAEGIMVGRGDWAKSGKAIHTEDAPVNLVLTATFDGNNRKLNVKVEGLYTLAVTEPSHRLNIMVTESDIVGYQSGTGGGSSYVHNHMLRGFITPMDENVWGAEIPSPAQGNSFQFEYDYDLPVHINNIPIKPENIEIIAFVCAGKTEVLNVTGGKPTYINFEKPLNATLLKPGREIGARYAFNFFEAQLKNLSSKKLTTAKFEVTINGNVNVVEWNGEIPPFETKSIVINTPPYSISTTNQYTIKLVALNNENYEGNTISGDFNAPAETTEKIRIEIKTDLHADENHFYIKDEDGNIVQEFGPYPSDLAAIYNETITLEKNKNFCFEVTDDWWDGMKGAIFGAPKGYFKLFNGDDELIIQNYDIKLWGERVFLHTSKGISVNENTLQKACVIYNPSQQTIDISFTATDNGTVHLSLYSITGTLLIEKSVHTEEGQNMEISLPASKYGKGIYLLNINQGNKNTTQKIIIY